MIEKIIELIEKDRLIEAMTQLEALLDGAKLYRLKAKLDEVRTSYGYMLSYMRQGAEDENRRHLYRQLKTMLRMLAEQIRLWQQDQTENTFYHTMRKVIAGRSPYRIDEAINRLAEFADELAVCQLMPRANQIEILKKHEQTARDLFLNTWCNSGWTVTEQAVMGQALTDEAITIADRQLIVSAITLSLIQYLDPLKLSLLADTCRHADTRISQRALVGVALVAINHPDTIGQHADALISLSTIFDSGMARKLNTIYLQLLRAQGTEGVDKKMREEIIPEMMKNVGNLGKFAPKLDEEEEEQNPEWKNDAHAQFEDKLRQMSELQQAGADVYISTFAALKTYPFFHELSNWLLPFDPLHSSVVDMFGIDGKADNRLLQMLLYGGAFCDSDKYSLCFTMNMMPREGRDTLLAQLTDQGMDAFEDEGRMMGMKQYAERPEVIGNGYIQDLYRFFKLHPRCKEFKNPFTQTIALHRLPVFNELLNVPEYVKQVADLLFGQERYEEVFELYIGLEKEECDAINADFYRRFGYCAQKLKQYSKAIECYERADLMQPNHLWTLRRLATCCRLKERYEEAAHYYRQIEEFEPENTQVLLQIAGCLANSKQYEEALSSLKKAYFLDASNLKIVRALAWCYFLQGNYKQASKYTLQVLDAQPDAADYLNAGHLAWMMNDVRQAVDYYRQAASVCTNREEFIQLFNKDAETLLQRGVTEEDMALMKELTISN